MAGYFLWFVASYLEAKVGVCCLRSSLGGCILRLYCQLVSVVPKDGEVSARLLAFPSLNSLSDRACLAICPYSLRLSVSWGSGYHTRDRREHGYGQSCCNREKPSSASSDVFYGQVLLGLVHCFVRLITLTLVARIEYIPCLCPK